MRDCVDKSTNDINQPSSLMSEIRAYGYKLAFICARICSVCAFAMLEAIYEFVEDLLARSRLL